MVPTMLKQVVVCAVLAVWTLGMLGCGVNQSEYDAKAVEAKNQTEKVSQLQKDLDAVKGEVDKARQARKKDAEAKTKALEQENANFKEQIKTLEQRIIDMKANSEKAASQFEKDIAAARNEGAKIDQARKAAEARVKALEQENAELRKKANAKPLDFLKKKT
jgi:septal ring factor EnvC (AmiA/AmiB activator)